MNTYHKYAPNVFLAKCTDEHEKGEIIPVTTKHGKENDSIVFNLVYERDGFYFYSIVREDGFNVQEWAKRKAERLSGAAEKAEAKSNEYYNTSHKLVENIPMGQPILVGHHSERHHRRTLDKSWNAMGKSVEYDKKASDYAARAEYWERKADTINLSMPESIDYFEFQLEKALKEHEGLKNGTIPRDHSYTLTYSKKNVNDLQKKIELAKRLWQ